MSILYSARSDETLDPQGGARQPTGFFDLVPAFFDNTRKNYLFASENIVLHEAERRQAAQYRRETGRDIGELMPRDRHSRRRDRTPASRRAALSKKITESGVAVDNLQFLTQQVIGESDHRLQDTLARRVEGTGHVGAMLTGGIAAGMTDPLNLASMLLGAGAGRTLMQTIAIEAALNMAVEAGQQPQIQDWQAQLGKKYGMSEMAASVAFAGVGAGVLSGALKAPSSIWRSLREDAEGILKEAARAREPEILLLEHKPEGLTLAEHSANQANYLNNINRYGEVRDTVEQLKRGDVSLDIDQKLDPLAIAIRAASRGDEPLDVPAKKIDAAVKKALRERADESALNLRDKELSATKRKDAQKAVDQEQRRLQKNQEWWLDQARASLEAKAAKSGRQIDTRGRKFQAKLKAEAEKLRVEALARKANAKKVLRRKTATKEEKAQAARTVKEVDTLITRGKGGNWERLAMRAMEEAARRGGRPADYTADLLDEFKMETPTLIPKVVLKEADRLRAASMARQQAAEDLLANDSVAVRAKREAAMLRRGEVPERLQSTYDAGKAEVEFQVRRRAEYGDEMLARIARQQADDMARLSMHPKAPARSTEEVTAEIELKESPEYTGALDADTARMKEEMGDTMIDDGEGSRVSIRQLLDDADDAERNVTEVMTTCGIGKV